MSIDGCDSFGAGVSSIWPDTPFFIVFFEIFPRWLLSGAFEQQAARRNHFPQHAGPTSSILLEGGDGSTARRSAFAAIARQILGKLLARL